MKNFWRYFLVRAVVGFGVFLSTNLAAFAQEEKYYRHVDGHEFSGWGQGPDGNVVGLEVKLFVLMMETNNLSASPPGSPEHVAKGIVAVLDFIEERRPNAEAVLLSMLPSGFLPGDTARRKRITATNRLLEAICRERERVSSLAVHDLFLDDGGRWLPGLSLDGTHLARRGYDVLASALRPTMTEILSDHSEVKSTVLK